MQIFLTIYAIVLLLASVVTFAAYGLDKRQAQRSGRRISEHTLHLLAFAGGWPGAIAGQQVFRHKTQKLSFRIKFWLLLALHLALVGGIAYELAGR